MFLLTRPTSLYIMQPYIEYILKESQFCGSSSEVHMLKPRFWHDETRMPLFCMMTNNSECARLLSPVTVHSTDKTTETISGNVFQTRWVRGNRTPGKLQSAQNTWLEGDDVMVGMTQEWLKGYFLIIKLFIFQWLDSVSMFYEKSHLCLGIRAFWTREALCVSVR